PLCCQDLRLGAGAGTPRVEGRFVPTSGSIRPEGRRRLLRPHEAVRRRPGEAAAPSRLRLVFFLEIEAQVIAAVQQAPQAARRDQEPRSEEHTSELQSLRQLVCRLLLEKKKRLLRDGRDWPLLHHCP